MHFDVILAMRAEKLRVLTLPGADNKPTQLFVLKEVLRNGVHIPANTQ